MIKLDNIGIVPLTISKLTARNHKKSKNENLNILLEALNSKNFKKWSTTIMDLNGDYFSIFSDYLKNENKTSQEEQQFWQEVIQMNFGFIKTSSFSCSSYYQYKEVNQKFLKLIVTKCHYGSSYLDVQNEDVYPFFKKRILQEEQLRLKFQQDYSKINEWIYTLTDERIAKILQYFEEEGLKDNHTEEIIKQLLEEKKQHYESLKIKKEVIKQEKDIDLSGLNLKIIPVTPTYTMKDIKRMIDSLDAKIKKVRDGEKISLTEYLKYLQNILILEQQKQAGEEHIKELFEALQLDWTTYSFIEAKAQSLLPTNLGIDIYPLLKDINDIKDICQTSTNEQEIAEFKNYLYQKYKELHTLLMHNSSYERKIVMTKETKKIKKLSFTS